MRPLSFRLVDELPFNRLSMRSMSSGSQAKCTPKSVCSMQSDGLLPGRPIDKNSSGSQWLGAIMSDSLPGVVIVGGGFAGLAAAKALRKTPARIILIDRCSHHLLQRLLYQVATSVLTQGKSARRFEAFSANSPTLR
jgi:hypothetical protein